MNLKHVDVICYVVCLISIVVGLACALLLIWGDVADNQMMWRVLGTSGACFLSSALLLSVNRMIDHEES